MSKSNALYMTELERADNKINELMDAIKFVLKDENSSIDYETKLILEQAISI